MKSILLIGLLTLGAATTALADSKTQHSFKALSDIAKGSSDTIKAIAQNIH